MQKSPSVAGALAGAAFLILPLLGTAGTWQVADDLPWT